MIVTTYSVFCDGMDGDAPCVRWIAQTTQGAREARLWAKECGWRTVRSKDFCPAHIPKGGPR